MNRMLIVGFSIISLSTSAFAAQVNSKVTNSNTEYMSCAQTQAAVGGSKGHGTLLATGGNQFDLYHRVGSECTALHESKASAFVKTKDNQSCFIGYTCDDNQD